MTSTFPLSSWSTRPRVACAWSEVFDKLTILRLKRMRLDDTARRDNVARELAAVEEVVGDMERFPLEVHDAVRELAEVNGVLWDVEDATRACETAQCFDAAFVALARAVYRENDRRAGIKRRIDRLLGSEIVAEKTYLTAG